MTAETARIERLAAAGEWLLRLNDDARSERDVSEWLAWCDASPENVEAFELVQRDWQDLNALKREEPQAQNTSWFVMYWRLAAGIAVTAVTLTFATYYWRAPGAPIQQVATAAVNKTATLPDGSSIVLGAQTQVDVDFTATARELSLSRGEAYFKVHQDKQRPFTVHAGEVSVTALGTAFNVRRGNDRIIITVEEGLVQVAQGDGNGKNTWRAEAGYQLTYSATQRTANLAAVNPATALKWRNGELAYVSEPLGNVIEDVNRYSNHRIVFEDVALMNLRFTGTVFTASVEDWLTAIQDAYAVRAQTRSNGDIVLGATTEFKKSSITR